MYSSSLSCDAPPTKGYLFCEAPPTKGHLSCEAPPTKGHLSCVAPPTKGHLSYQDFRCTEMVKSELFPLQESPPFL